MEAKAMHDTERNQDSGVAELVIGGLMMLVGLGLFVYALQSAVSDLPYTASAWLIGFALAAPGVFLWSYGMRKQRIATESEEQKAEAQKLRRNAETVATQAIERARKK